MTRFAPSPTGRLHVGNIRTAVLNWLVARRAGGTFLLRIDDTDRTRSEERFVDEIKRDLDWLGLGWDRELRQSDRLDLYHGAAERLRHSARAYECFETPLELDLKRKKQLAMGKPPVYDRAALLLTNAERDQLRLTRNPHLRFLLNGGAIVWEDAVRGTERVDAGSISDPVLIRADGQLLYTLASVVDDIETGVTHVVRGADHVTNTGAQIQIFEALGTSAPVFGHHSLLTGPEGEALSKRLGTLAIGDLREAGVEPAALVAFMARLGSAKPVEVILTPDALVAEFALSDFGLAPTRFDPEELHAHSAKTLRAMPVEDVWARLATLGVPEAERTAFWAAVGPNLTRFDEVEAWWRICRDGADPYVAPEDAAFVATALELLPPRPWSEDTWKDWSAKAKEATGRKGKALFLPLRRVLTGKDSGPDMALLMPLLRHP
ncbi:MAG: glutamate--tRNA ligase [Paracoccaceae bacterium]